MGNGRWDSSSWTAYAAGTVKGRTRSQIFTSTDLAEEFDPARIKVRESRDGPLNPAATPIVLASDVTGSMGEIAHVLMRDGLNTLATEVYERKLGGDPHVMVMAVGDARTDRAPLQATQFEADIGLADQVRRLYVEGNGGANDGESYSGAHLFAALKTSHDAYEVRRRKGYLFTIGDEPIHDGMTRDQVKRVLGLDVEADISARDAIAMASRTYEVFHVVLCNEGYAGGSRAGLDRVMRSWKPLLPERVMPLERVDLLAEAVVSAIQVAEGQHKDAVAASWTGKGNGTALVVANAIGGLAASGRGGGVRRLGA